MTSTQQDTQIDPKFFSKEEAAEYDNEFTFAIGHGIAENLLRVGAEMAGKDVWSSARVLDFACGTGIVSQVCIDCCDLYAIR